MRDKFSTKKPGNLKVICIVFFATLNINLTPRTQRHFPSPSPFVASSAAQGDEMR